MWLDSNTNKTHKCIALSGTPCTTKSTTDLVSPRRLVGLALAADDVDAALPNLPRRSCPVGGVDYSTR